MDARDNPNNYQWAEVREGVRYYPCHSAQLDVLGSKARYTAAFAGAQGGKTAIIPLWLYKIIASKKGAGRYLIASPTIKMIKQSQVIDHLRSCFQGTPIQGKYNKTDNVYSWGKGEIIIRSTDIPQNLDAGVYDAIVIDEAAKVDAEAWQRLQVRSGAKKAPILVVTTPDIVNWIYEDLYLKAKAKEPDYFVRQWTSIDRPGYDREAYERLKATLPPAMFERIMNGEFAKLDGLVYESFASPEDQAYPVIKGNPDKLPSPVVKVFGGIDWGFSNDPCAVLIMALCEDGRIYVVEEFYEKGKDVDELAPLLRRLMDKWSITPNNKYAELLDSEGSFTRFYCDVSRPELMQLMRKHGIPVQNKRVSDIANSVMTTAAMFRADRLKVYSSCSNTIEEAKKYAWGKSKSGSLKDEPTDKDNHAMDALRYAVSSFMYGKTIRPLEREELPQEDKDAQELEKLQRLSVIESPKQLEDKAEEMRNKRFIRLAIGDLLD